MEQPNLTLIKEISGNDLEFQNSILEIIKEEFPLEVNLFHTNFEANDLDETAKNVHKIKHKISLLGLKEGAEIAGEFEIALKYGNTKLHPDFLEILNKINVYLYR